MAVTPNRGLTYLEEQQANAEITVNDNVNQHDVSGNHYIVKQRLSTPPGSPADGDAYYIIGSPTGDWAGKAGMATAYWAGWVFYTVPEGSLLTDKTDKKLYIKNSAGNLESVFDIGVSGTYT
jgi:hypothetical protein